MTQHEYEDWAKSVTERNTVPPVHSLIIAIVACVIAGALIWFVR